MKASQNHSQEEQSEHLKKDEDPIVERPEFTLVKTDLLENLKKEAEQSHELQDKLIRTQADWDNYRKRMQKEKEDAVKYAAEGFLEKLLPILDSFEAGLQAAQSATEAKAIAQGMEMVLKQFSALLKESGVEMVEAVGHPFDPHRHEAWGHHETSEHAEGTIVKESRKGYKLKDRLLRPAAVFVAKAPQS